METETLHAQLESELPRELAADGGSALFVCGWCYCQDARITELELIVDDERQPVMSFGAPRLDTFSMLHPQLDPFATAELDVDSRSDSDPRLHSYRSGFWGMAKIAGPRSSGTVRIGLRARLEGGGEACAELARVELVSLEDPVDVCWPQKSGPMIAICMATYNPPTDLLTRQLESIRSQTHENWVCIVSDDCSVPERYQQLLDAIGTDPRFVVSRSTRRSGFYNNFERALALAPADAEFVAMADQDDCWRADKLATLAAEIGSAQLVYSDARVVSRDGQLISDTWWNVRGNNHSDLLSLLVANSVTGAASLLRRDLLSYALPFPPAQFAHFHDHWIALVALSVGDIKFVDRPLYDYVQHGGAALGHAAANQMPSLGSRLRSAAQTRARVRMWRLHYFVDVCRLLQVATVLELRCAPQMARGKRRTLRRWLRSDRSLRSLTVLAARGARELLASGKPETLGAEWMLFHALAWRRLLYLSARNRPQSRLRLDALPPQSLYQQPGRIGLDESARVIGEKIAPLRWTLDQDAPQRVNLLIPAIDLHHFFGGYIGKLNLAKRLVQRGLRVRIVTVDPVGPLPRDWRMRVEAYSGLEGLFDHVEVAFGRESSMIATSAADAFIATTWWTAHIARDAGEVIGRERFLYLIQEYEPFTFPMSTYAALAAQSYTFPHVALFSSELLRGYFREHAIGVYASGVELGDEASASFENAITPVRPPTVDELARREVRRLLFYARPEPHAARNMFELGLLALARALEDGAFDGSWELHGIGTVQGDRRISLGADVTLELLPRSDQDSYSSLLREHDVGLALMYTPHPSLVPIEMASAGLLTVTNSFENKTPDAMATISSNLITAEPTVDGIALALCQASADVRNFARRVQGSDVRWSRDWDQSLGDELIDWLLSGVFRPDLAIV